MIRKLGGWGGGGATRCEGVRAALSPTETLGWHMGTMSPWGQSDGEGSTTLSPPPTSPSPPPQEQHFLGYVNARSRAPFRPRRPRGVGEMEGGGGGGFAPRAERAAVPPARCNGNNGCGSP